MTGSENQLSEIEPFWRGAAREAVRPYQDGIDILAEALGLAARELKALLITREQLTHGGWRSVLPIFLARSIGTVDAAHAAAQIGRVEQIIMLNRTLMDLEIDALLITGDERAIAYYADWANCEQAKLALSIRPDQIVRPGRDLERHRRRLAKKLVHRLIDLGLDSRPAARSFPPIAELHDLPLDVVLEAFNRIRFASRRPSSWRRAFREAETISQEDFTDLITASFLRTLVDANVPAVAEEMLDTLFRQEMGLFYARGSGEIHNSPMALNRLVDAETLDIRAAGDLEQMPTAVLNCFQHLYRQSALLRAHWETGSDFAAWDALSNRVSAWADRVAPVPSQR